MTRMQQIPDGSTVRVDGFVMLRGVDAGRYRVTHHRDGKSYVFHKPRGKKPIARHYMTSVDAFVRGKGDKDLNKIIVESVAGGAMAAW